jgi:hypothetical protein
MDYNINYEESAKMSNKILTPLGQNDSNDFEIYREALVECEFE